MAVVVTAALQGTYTNTFTIAADAGDHGTNSAATNHTLGVTPLEWHVMDTTTGAIADEGNVWAIHTVSDSQFTVRKISVTANNRTALVTLKRPHSIEV